MSALANHYNSYGKGRGVFLDTTDATQTVAARFVTTSNKVYSVRAYITGAKTTDYSQQAFYVRHALYKNAAGTLALVGSIGSVTTIESDASWDVTLDAAGENTMGDGVTTQNIRVLVTGVAATNITWSVQMDITEVGTWVANQGIVS